ncbi:MAG: protein kinase [Ardenticatenaceae bacterium]|nr:protein kinase [Ardenticatenaceae bacterium]
MIGQQIDRYTISEVIGQGGMASVYRAYDGRFERDVAIKFLYQSPEAHDMLTAERFAQEAKIIAGLEHHAIVPVYDYGEYDGRPYLVMRLMDGGTLKDRLIADDLTLADIAAILARICAALDKAHQQHVVHRDIKPGNILFDADGMAYLADFGIARLTDRTQTMSLIGSPRYMAPEQARGEKLTRQTDIYQMGVVLFHMLTGRVPFNADTTESILYQHVYEPIPSVVTLAPDLSPSCDEVMRQVLAKKPDERFPSAGALARAFQVAIGYSPRPFGRVDPPMPPAAKPTPLPAVQTPPAGSDEATFTFQQNAPPGQETEHQAAAPETIVDEPAPSPQPPTPITHHPSPTTQHPPTAPKRGWGWIIVLSVVAIALFACGAGLFVLANPELIFPNLENPVVDLGTRPPPTAPTATSAGELESISDPEVAPTVTIANETPENGEITLLLDQEELLARGGGSGTIAYAANRNPEDPNAFDIFVVDEDGSERQITSYVDADFRPVFSPDGRKIAYHSLRDTWEIFVINTDGSGQVNISNNPADDSFPAWSPDGTQIAFHSNRVSTQFDIFVANADGSNVRQLTNTTDLNELGPSWSPDGTKITFHRQLPDNTRQIFVMDADGSNEVQITEAEGRSEYPVWSPDGAQLVFFSTRSGTAQIYTMNPDGSEVAQVTRGDTGSFYPTWSTNGQWIVYHTIADDTNRELVMIRPDGSEQTFLTETDTQERMPAWAP